MDLEKSNGGFSFFLEKVVWFSFLALVFSLALMQPFIYFRDQRLSVTDFIFPIVVLLWLVSLFVRQNNFRWHKFYWFLLFYFCSMLFSALFSINPSQSLIKLLGGIYLIGLSVLTFNLVESERQIKDVVKVWLAGTFAAVSIGIFSLILFYTQPESQFLDYTTYHYGSVPVGNYPRLSSTFISASMFCNYLNVGFLLILTAIKTQILNKKFLLVLLALVSVCAVFTISAGLGGFALGGGLWIWLIFREKNRKFAALCLMSASAAAFLFFLMNFAALQKHSSAAYSFKVPLVNLELQPSARVLIWQESLQTFWNNLISGVGLGQDVCRVVFQNTEGTTSVLTDAHNYLINAAAQNGIFGLLAITAITLFVIRLALPYRLKNSQSSIILSGLSAAFACSFVYQGLTGSFEDARHLWVLIGLILSAQHLTSVATETIEADSI